MNALRQIPPVHEILRHAKLRGMERILEQPFAARIVDQVVDELRAELRGDASERSRVELASVIADDVRRRIDAFLTPSLRPLINATGVVLHTNLGRAPLPASAVDGARDIAASYSNLEFDAASGRRGKRDTHVARLLSELLGCEAAIVVNNNAAALLLVLNTLAEGGEALVSRGEEIEIGDSFRIPEVMAKSGARIREVGTTNRTRIEDYRSAVVPETRLLLRVHPSNFTVVGFTERPSLAQFVALGRETGVPMLEDLGSGCIGDLTAAGLPDEPRPQRSIELGVDLVCFSGDKLLGGPQAGIVAGRKPLVERVRRNPLFRALRVDKLTLATLEWVLRAHLRGDMAGIPAWRMLRATDSELRERAEALTRRLGQDAVVPTALESVVGGGSVPEGAMPSWGLRVTPAGASPRRLERQLREGAPSVVVRIEDDAVLLDLRTVFPEDDDKLAEALRGALA